MKLLFIVVFVENLSNNSQIIMNSLSFLSKYFLSLTFPSVVTMMKTN